MPLMEAMIPLILSEKEAIELDFISGLNTFIIALIIASFWPFPQMVVTVSYHISLWFPARVTRLCASQPFFS